MFYLTFSEPAVSLAPETEAQFMIDKEEKQANRSLEMKICVGRKEATGVYCYHSWSVSWVRLLNLDFDICNS